MNIALNAAMTVGLVVTLIGIASFFVPSRQGRTGSSAVMIVLGFMLVGAKTVIPVVLSIIDAVNSVLLGMSGRQPTNRHRLADGWSRWASSASSASASASTSATAHNVPSGTIHESATPSVMPSAKPSVTSTPSATDPHASQAWSHIWPWLLAAAALVVIIAAGIWLIAHANAKRAEIAEAAAAKREQRRREAEIRAQVDKDWSAAQARHDALLTKWDKPDHDLATLLSMPAIRDVSVPTTAAAIESIMTADELRTPHAPEGCTNAKTTDYVKSVGAADRAITAALAYARRDALSSMSNEERRKLSLAQQLLATAQNAAATPSERQIAYGRVRALMDELRIEVPERVMEAIETETRQLLEAASA